MVGAQGLGSQWQAAAAHLPGSFPEFMPPLCPVLPSPEGWDQGASLEAGRPRELAGGNCNHLSDRRGLSSDLGGGSVQEPGKTGRDPSLALWDRA